jgi:hypothetical protein
MLWLSIQERGQRLKTSSYATFGGNDLDLFAFEIGVSILQTHSKNLLVTHGVESKLGEVIGNISFKLGREQSEFILVSFNDLSFE